MTVGELLVTITGDSSSLESSIKNSQKGLGEFQVSVGKTIGAISSVIAGLGVVIKGIQFNAAKESAEASFEVMLGSAESAADMIGRLQNAAANTPLEFPSLQQAAQTLLQFGVAAGSVEDVLMRLGDISGGNAEKLQSLAVVFGQVSSAGKLTGQDLLQFINVGFNPLLVMAENMSKELGISTTEAMAKLRREMEKGGISAQEVADVIRQVTNEGGRFFGMMEKQSETFSGRLSTATDSFNMMLGALTEGMMGPLKDAFLILSRELPLIGEKLRPIGVMLGGIIKIITDGFSFFASIIKALPGEVVAIASAIGIAAAAAVALGASLGPIGIAIAAIVGAIGLAVGKAEELKKQSLEDLKKEFGGLADMVEKSGGRLDGLRDRFKDLQKMLGQISFSKNLSDEDNLARLQHRVDSLTNSFNLTKSEMAEVILKTKGLSSEVLAYGKILQQQGKVEDEIRKKNSFNETFVNPLKNQIGLIFEKARAENASKKIVEEQSDSYKDLQKEISSLNKLKNLGFINEEDFYKESLKSREKYTSFLKKEFEAGKLTVGQFTQKMNSEKKYSDEIIKNIEKIEKEKKDSLKEEKEIEKERQKIIDEEIKSQEKYIDIIKNRGQSASDASVKEINLEYDKIIAYAQSSEEIKAINKERADKIIEIKSKEAEENSRINNEIVKTEQKINDEKAQSAKESSDKVINYFTSSITGVLSELANLNGGIGKTFQTIASYAENAAGIIANIASQNYVGAIISIVTTITKSIVSGINANEEYLKSLDDISNKSNKTLSELRGGFGNEFEKLLASFKKESAEVFLQYQKDIEQLEKDSRDHGKTKDERLRALRLADTLKKDMKEALSLVDEKYKESFSKLKKDFLDKFLESNKTTVEKVKDLYLEMQDTIALATRFAGANAQETAAISEYYLNEIVDKFGIVTKKELDLIKNEFNEFPDVISAFNDKFMQNFMRNFDEIEQGYENFFESLGSISGDIASALSDGFISGLEEADFLESMKKKITELAVQGALFSTGIAEKMGEIGSIIGFAVSDGFTSSELTDIRSRLQGIFAEASAIINPITGVINDVFESGQNGISNNTSNTTNIVQNFYTPTATALDVSDATNTALQLAAFSV